MRNVLYALDNLKIELNMLSLSPLSPSTITPSIPKYVLTEIESRLPDNLRLPADLQTKLWYFYRTLTCKTLLEDDKILIVISVLLIWQR